MLLLAGAAWVDCLLCAGFIAEFGVGMMRGLFGFGLLCLVLMGLLSGYLFG